MEQVPEVNNGEFSASTGARGIGIQGLSLSECFPLLDTSEKTFPLHYLNVKLFVCPCVPTEQLGIGMLPI